MSLRAMENPFENRLLQKDDIVLADLTDFDVQIGVTEDKGIQIFEVTDIVSQWMNEVFGQCLKNGGWATDEYARFDTIILLQRAKRRLQENETETEDEEDLFLDSETPLIGELYTAQFKGAALFSQAQGQMEVPSEEIYDCQKIAFLRDDLLLESFQGSDSTGLGTAVVDAQAYVVNNPNSGSSSSSDDSLELVIIIAIVIACVAFLFLIFAIFWAWRYDKRNRRAFLAENRKSTTDETFDAGDSPESKEKPTVKTQANKKTPVLPSYPSVIGGESQADGGVYPESVISEDIHSSLSQYYTGGAAGNYNYSNGRLQDAASVSSMESYGYSLDGYTQSVTTPMPTKLLPTEPANTDSWMDTKDLRTDDESGNDWGVSTDYKYSLKSALDGPGVIVSGDLPTDEEEMPPPSDIEDQSMLESMMDESAIHTAVFTADDR